MKDLFHALGYHEFVLNVPKSGREIDLRGRHRATGHLAVVECKATSDPIGGSELNKFAGALQIEQARASDKQLDGYFISLSGFRSSALEQESELAERRLVLMNGHAVVEELISGKIVVPRAAAAAAAATCLPRPTRLASNPSLELLAHDSGWYWAAIFAEGASPSAVALIHADGTPLNATSAEPILEADADAGGPLSELTLLAQAGPVGSATARDAALEAYRAFLSREYGVITVDGLPADEHLESQSIALSDLFVPMHLQECETNEPPPARPTNDEATAIEHEPPGEEWDDWDGWGDDPDEDSQRVSVGRVLTDKPRIAILGPPGSGKSTLLKRLAIAYGLPGARTALADELPDRAWLPLVIRCRQLDGLVSGSFHDIVRDIPRRAEIPDHADAFLELVDSALRDGSALILVDGLDEIADSQLRLTFAKQLRTFMGTYPGIQLVATSREAGFRIVAGALCDVSASYRAADFDDSDIQQLTVAWTVLTSRNSSAARAEGEEIAQTIIETDRVRRLARNPLLLTTLLLVRRWVGDLPKKRTALYAKAIEVLLMTWNVEGHKPIDLDEAIPQLAYVAYAMTRDGTQSLSRPKLVSLLEEARSEMLEVLGHAQIAPGQFLERIEDRSSLLSLSGHALQDGRLVALYEFKHLTFQEYLAAVAIAEGYYPDRSPNDTPEQLILPRLRSEHWFEVILMAAVLAGRRALPTVGALINMVNESSPKHNELLPESHFDPHRYLLAQFVADEVQMPPKMVSEAAGALADMSARYMAEEQIQAILSGKYAPTFRAAVEDGFLSGKGHYWRFATIFKVIAMLSHVPTGSDGGEMAIESNGSEAAIVATVQQLLDPGSTELAKAEGGMIAMRLCHEAAMGNNQVSADQLYQIEKLLRPSLDASNPGLRFATSWAYVWLGGNALDGRRFVPHVLPAFYRLWKSREPLYVRRLMAWALASQPLIPRSSLPLGEPTSLDLSFLEKEASSGVLPTWVRDDRRPAALVASYYFNGPYRGKRLRERVVDLKYAGVQKRLLRRL